MPAKRKRIDRHRKRLILLTAKIALAVAAVALVAFLAYRFVVSPLRAKDLAAKALASVDSGNYRMAWLQISSARQLGPTDPSVLRAAAIFEGKLGRRESLELWEQVARQASLDNDDRTSRAVAAMLFGSDEQFTAALAELEEAGDNVKAEALRISRLSTRGNLSLAIAEAQRASAATNDPGLKLGYAKLLLRYHAVAGEGPTPPQSIAAFQEMAALVDEMQSTPEARNALAFGLDYLKVPDDVRRRWIEAALADVSPDNPALLPAAEGAVESGYLTAAELHAKLGPVYDKSPLDQRCAYSLWLSAQGMPREAVSLITPVEGTGDPVAFAARAAGLAGLGNWPAIVAAADSATGPPESVRVLSRARAEIAIGGPPKALSSIRLGLQAAAREGRLPAAVGMVDNLEGGPAAVDDQLVLLSAQTGTADLAFRMLRARWSRTQGTDALLPAYNAASQASPDAPSVRDFGRYLALIAEVADEEEENEIPFDDAATRDALAADPGDINARITRALHLLRQNQPDEAHAVFDDITIFFETLPPGQQAVIAAINQARGQRDLASAMLATIDTSALNAGERGLLHGIVAGSDAK
jgi:hypothetical protein